MAIKHLVTSCVSVIGFVGMAHASTTTLTFKGDVLSGTDVIGSFGTRGADLSQKKYEAVYTIDYDQPGSYYSNLSQYYVGSSNPSNNPVVTSTLTIDGVTLNNAANGGDFTFLTDGATSPFGQDELGAYTQAYSGSIVDQLTFNVRSSNEDFIKSLDFSKPIKYRPNKAISGGHLYMYGFDPLDMSKVFTTYLDLRIGSVQLGDVAAAVPELSTWSFMIAGMALVGGAMRRRHPRCTASAW